MASEGFYLTQRQVRRINNALDTVDMLSKQVSLLQANRPVVQPQRHDHFKNESGEKIPRFAVFAVDDEFKLDEGNDFRRMVKAVRPSSEFHDVYLLANAFPVESSEFGALQHGPLYLAAYETGTPEFGEIWGPKPDSWYLHKGYFGFRIMGVQDEEKKIAQVLPAPASYIGKCTSSVSKGSTGTFKIWTKASGSWAAINNWEVTAECTFAAYTANKFAELKQVGNTWVAMNLEC